MPRRSQYALPCAVERFRSSSGAVAFRASMDVTRPGEDRRRVRAKGQSVGTAVARLVARLQSRGFTVEAEDLAAAAVAQFGPSFGERVASFQRSRLPTVSAAVEHNIDAALASGSRNAQTTERMRGLLRNHISTHALGSRHLDEVTRADLERFFDALASEVGEDGTPRLGPSPRRSIHGLLSQVFAAALEAEEIARDPMVGVQRARKPRRPAAAQFAEHANAAATVADLARRMDYQDFLRQWPLFLGLRTSERLALQHKSFAPDREGVSLAREERTTVLRVTQQLGRDAARSVLPLKTDGSARDFTLPLLFFPHLDALYLRRACQIVAAAQADAAVGVKAGARLLDALASWEPSAPPVLSSHGSLVSPLFAPDSFLITASTGQPYRQQKANEMWARTVEAAGVSEHIREHDLRHVAATFLARWNVSEATVASITGHAVSGRSTLSAVYTHATEEARTEALEWLACLYARPAEPPRVLPAPVAEFSRRRPLWSLWREARAWDFPADDDAARSEFWDGPDGLAHRAAMNLWLPANLRPNVAPVPSTPETPEWHAVFTLDPRQYELRGIEYPAGRG